MMSSVTRGRPFLLRPPFCRIVAGPTFRYSRYAVQHVSAFVASRSAMASVRDERARLQYELLFPDAVAYHADGIETFDIGQALS